MLGKRPRVTRTRHLSRLGGKPYNLAGLPPSRHHEECHQLAPENLHLENRAEPTAYSHDIPREKDQLAFKYISSSRVRIVNSRRADLLVSGSFASGRGKRGRVSPPQVSRAPRGSLSIGVSRPPLVGKIPLVEVKPSLS